MLCYGHRRVLSRVVCVLAFQAALVQNLASLRPWGSSMCLVEDGCKINQLAVLSLLAAEMRGEETMRPLDLEWHPRK